MSDAAATMIPLILLTDCNGLNLNSFFYVRIIGVVHVFSFQDLLAAKSVDKGCPP